ncbi:MAG: tetratricopeptide repeat protein [Hyphomonadaceae bacterium]
MRGKSAALYGRFTPGARDRLAGEIARAGGVVARDLTRRSDLFVVGAGAISLIDGGHLDARLEAARARRVPVYGERRFAEALSGAPFEPATAPLATIEAQTGLSRGVIDVLAAFDVVTVEGEFCRFGDAQTLRTAAEILGAERSLSDCVKILAKARDLAPRGRRKIVLGPRGQAALQWETGLTTLEGQGYLPLGDEAQTVEALFEEAALAEAEGDVQEAARLYEQCARFDKRDAIAPFNLGNLHCAAKAYDQAVLAYKMAIARDGEFVEARYNLAQAYEALEKFDLARGELLAALKTEPLYGDALFNLAQLELKRGEIAEARALFERYLEADPPSDWAAKARRAIQYCTARLSA